MMRHSGKGIFALRFVVGLRFFAPLLAGSLKIKWEKFFFYNLMALFVYVPLIIFLGYHFHNNLLAIISGVELVRHVIFAVVLVLGGYLIAILHRKVLKKY